tara:strand:- start:165 stop:773 length:609 start_codon:yes stop_codon:yes gene_type:complete
MQKSFTQKMQGVKASQDKIKLVDDFNRDPVGFTQRLAQQYGITNQQSDQKPQDASGAQAEQFAPKNWDDVFSEFQGRLDGYLNNRFAPVINEVKNVKQKQIESILDEEEPSWREYEDDMVTALREHPTLANEPSKLIRMVMPGEVWEGRAMQKALKRIEDKGKSARTSAGSTVNQPTTSTKQKGNMTFADAVEAAKESLAGR